MSLYIDVRQLEEQIHNVILRGELQKRIQLSSINCSCSPIARTRKFQNQMIEVAKRWQEEHLPRRGRKNYWHNGIRILLKHNHKGFTKRKDKYRRPQVKMIHSKQGFRKSNLSFL